jgi:hypothetical protein
LQHVSQIKAALLKSALPKDNKARLSVTQVFGSIVKISRIVPYYFYCYPELALVTRESGTLKTAKIRLSTKIKALCGTVPNVGQS